MSLSQSFTQECLIIRETDAAILIDVDGEEIWIPLSQVDKITRGKTSSSVTMALWIARQKGLAD